ncbi:hypothetical protein RND71_012573 [Anisodus tanguticus]|uniref:Protein kinase domain-containing protein n=1 Tax=Anisodus tanguticus TaxID=243964 RepID=A0AAE1SHA7_9SOLA|nr:hypothetical protein RND71_012573 [Anisodus tanguticus]
MEYWKKLYVLGAGSYGKVYYAVKIDFSSSCASVAAVKCAYIRRSISLKQEAQIVTTLKGCPYIVQFFGAHLKLADFGLSLRVGDGMAYVTGPPLSNRGTLLYAPPESLTGGFHAKAYDIWSLGCTVAEMMTGSRLWIYCYTKDLLWQIINGNPVIPITLSVPIYVTLFV